MTFGPIAVERDRYASTLRALRAALLNSVPGATLLVTIEDALEGQPHESELARALAVAKAAEAEYDRAHEPDSEGAPMACLCDVCAAVRVYRGEEAPP